MGHEPVVPERARDGHLACDRSELVAWGERFGRLARAPLVVMLSGDLGAGKTTLAQAICRGYGVSGDVTSPTFAIVHRYVAPRSAVVHIDLFRIENAAELSGLAWDELLSEEALILIEWPEHAAGLMPHDAVSINLYHVPGDSARRLLYAGGHA